MAKNENKSITPLGDRVLVFPLAKEDVTASGILIPDSANREKPEQGTVIAVGNGKYNDGVKVPMTLKVGDTILFSKYGYDEVKLDGKDYYILSESNVLAIIK
ncbi:MAG: co-chaperone GroES [Patescibacteria group bacterium]